MIPAFKTRKSSPADQTLRALQAEHDAISLAHAVIEFSMDGRILYANEQFLAAMGYAADEVVGRHHSMFVTADYAQLPEYRTFWTQLNNGETLAAKFERRGKGGRTVWIEASYIPIPGPDGKPVKVVKYATDITASVLEAAEHASQLAAIGRSQAVISFDLDGNILSANENFLKAVGYEGSEIIGRHHRMFVRPAEAGGAAYQEFWTKLRAGTFVAGTFRRQGKDGREIWLNATYNPILDPAGRPVKIIKFATDVTETKRRAAVDAGKIAAIDRSQAVIEFTPGGVILAANQNFLDTMGYTESEIVGRQHSMFVTPSYAASTDYQKFWNDLRAGKNYVADFMRVAKNGREVWLHGSYNPMYDAGGALIGVVKYASDITKDVAQRAEFKLLSLVANETDNSVVITGRDRRIVYVNPGFIRLTGLSSREVIGKFPGQLLQGPGTDQATVARIRENLSRGVPSYDEILNYDAARRPYWISLAINPVRGADGEIERFVSIQTNITETKLKSLEYTTKLDSISQTIMMAEWRRDGAPVTCNQLLKDSIGALPRLGEILDAETIARIIQEGSGQLQIPFARQQAEPVYIDAHFSVIRTIEGEVERVLMCGSDITQRRTTIEGAIAGMTGMMSQIGDVVHTINDLSRQTNFLALNAAVQAAQADEAGRGFTIIAQEIRKLAEGAADAIARIDAMLSAGRAQVEKLSSDTMQRPEAEAPPGAAKGAAEAGAPRALAAV